MTFPKLLVLTDRARMKPSWELALLAACQGGARWFCLREKDAAPREQLELYRRAARITERFGAQLFLNGRADLARAAHADGLHLPGSEISVADARLSLSFHTPIGRSVHSLSQAQQAQTEGANYLLFGSVWETASHPGQSAAGLEALEQVCGAVKLPVFAIGGVTAERAAQCVEVGAAGVALLSGIWGTDDVTAQVREVRAALGEKDVPLHGHGAAPATGNGTGSPLSDIISKTQRARQ